MTRKRFHGLKKVKVRATWNKYNLYNLSRLIPLNTTHKTFYQQKWYAKSASRAYHGEHIREGQWQRMFRPRMQAVVPMDHKYLAENDGSEQATGRGSGQEKEVDGNSHLARGRWKIPYLHMTYAPIERRLDMAVWRSLFASSARQARQFCIHGKVKVNGQVMPYAGYLLNPGDMFQVEPDSTLFATGAPKEQAQIEKGKKLRRARSRYNKSLRLAPLKPALKDYYRPSADLPSAEEEDGPALEDVTVAAPAKPVEPSAKFSTNMEVFRKERQRTLENMLAKAVGQFEKGLRKLGAKKKIELRAYIKDVRQVRSRINRKSEAELDAEIASLLSRYNTILDIKKSEPVASAKTTANEVARQGAAASEEHQKALLDAVLRIQDNPKDSSKPYATPWRPRPYMSPFAFIPRYLEVNHNICSAVYLRHPVARPWLAEVPTPFDAETQQLAFAWYLRRK